MTGDRDIEPGRLAERLRAADPPRLMDVRTGIEYRRHHIAGAEHVPFLRALFGHVDRERGPVVVICETAHRSLVVMRRLRRHGIEAYQLGGGMRAWRRAHHRARAREQP